MLWKWRVYVETKGSPSNGCIPACSAISRARSSLSRASRSSFDNLSYSSSGIAIDVKIRFLALEEVKELIELRYLPLIALVCCKSSLLLVVVRDSSPLFISQSYTTRV
jgi:hypothetical protein